jgi:magnesium chelatase family protein
MLSRRLPGILPAVSFEEALETTMVYSVAGMLGQRALTRERPFRAPHHTVSVAGLAGGGPMVRPGEISLAHNGVLFLDELLEFSRPVLETLIPTPRWPFGASSPGSTCSSRSPWL